MPCLLVILAVAFPRVAIVLLWFFSTFFHVLHPSILVPLLGFLFLPLTLLAYTFMLRTYGGHLGTTQLVVLFIAVLLDLGLLGGGAMRRGN